MSDNTQIIEKTTRDTTFKATKIPSDSLREKHWENVFQTKDYTQVLWHQNVPSKSLSLIEHYSNQGDSIIDVGCGASFLVDSLISQGYKDITLLDTSKTSLDIVKTRLNANSKLPKYICSDILGLKEIAKYNIWHDRALFHFLLLQKERKKYFEVLSKALISGGIAIINTFSIDSQTQCAGLPIVQYDEERMLEALPSDLTLIKTHAFTHTTPKNTEQNYNSFIIMKK
ncbi:methyltransferase domain-containing protein [Sulfurimonas sp.]|jgi:arsenite methyltransferase|uniref:methyltransferase domain-containing protein n=1 Tax=Sulfurimonas sp. TaxID=2022749 RepID=UPI0025D57BF0|nr:methyltransferase domain-containing protein [Sulfurimonas sp.]MBT5933932.1 class I SAM-dependent methyltransferase [Sulfurimonas sp.]